MPSRGLYLEGQHYALHPWDDATKVTKRIGIAKYSKDFLLYQAQKSLSARLNRKARILLRHISKL